MNMCIYNKAKENVAMTLGVATFADAAKINENKREKMVAKAQKKLKVKCHSKIQNLSSGDPYVMLNRKVNTDGKFVK